MVFMRNPSGLLLDAVLDRSALQCGEGPQDTGSGLGDQHVETITGPKCGGLQQEHDHPEGVAPVHCRVESSLRVRSVESVPRPQRIEPVKPQLDQVRTLHDGHFARARRSGGARNATQNAT